nr:zinc finger protein ZIC 2-B-like [Macaca fascicularis]
MVSRCKLRCFRAFPRARPLPPARAPRAHTHSRTHARTHALPGEGRAAASTACNRHTINNNRFLRSGLASRSPASAGGGGGGGGRGAGSSGPGAPPGPILGLPQGSRLRLTQPAGHPSGPPSASASLFAVLWGAGTHPPPPPTSRNK